MNPTRQGYTLVELMITVAIVGILSAMAGQYARYSRLSSLEEIQQEQARLVLDHHGARVAAGQEPDPQVLSRLLEGLPEAQVEQEAAAGLRTFTISWRVPGGTRSQQSLTIFAGGAP